MLEPYLCLHTELIAQAFLVLEKPTFRVLQLLHLSFPVLPHRQWGRAPTLSLLPSFPLSLHRCGATATADSSTRNNNPHCFHLCAGFSTHLAQMQNPKGLWGSTGSWMNTFWAVCWTSNLQGWRYIWASWCGVCICLHNSWCFFSFHAIASTSDWHCSRTCIQAKKGMQRYNSDF